MRNTEEYSSDSYFVAGIIIAFDVIAKSLL